MKKSALFGFSILSVFILCSLSYPPIIADEQIDSLPIVDVDCGCNSNNIDWDFPILCWILERLWYIIPQFSPFPVPLMHWVIIIIAESLGCQNIPP